ncbi:unnamed protein product [Adineta ricciae]|uniref:Uncharacterized protein n=1 Tax=Adineta ricciae TaxID=249248 RepID=A0A815KYQ1_ADIRI|nr:unnamed protein product [Adineta ricciae]CAF1453340.1 unnamed protein product [Adineta ricciae]
MDVDIIVNMELFLRDLHGNTAELHGKQYHGNSTSSAFVGYRGQGFLSTSKDRTVGLTFAYAKALLCLLEAVSITELNLPPDHDHLALEYENTAFIYDKTSRTSEALMYFKNSLNVRQKRLSSDDPKLIDSYGNIGWMFSGLSENVQALPSCEKVYDIYKSMNPSDNPFADVQEFFLHFSKDNVNK